MIKCSTICTKIIVACMALMLATAPKLATAQDFGTLLRDFEPSALSQSEKRFIQAALAFEGDYIGLLDGDWGKLSQRALENFSKREFGTEYEEWHLAFLAQSFFEKYEADGWAVRFFPAFNLSLLWPEKTITADPATESFLNYRHLTSSLSISLGRHAQEQTQSIHDFTLSKHEAASQPYSVRRTNFAVSSGTKRDGSTLYTRSNFTNGSWSTIMLSVESWDKSVLNAVSASISVGYAPSIEIDEGGRLEEAILKTAAVLERSEQDEIDQHRQKTADTELGRQPSPIGGSGSGFIVSENGHILTNAHVVQGCGDIWVDGLPAELFAQSPEFDLAILSADISDERNVAVFSAKSAKLNADVTAVGFPYAGVLGGLNVTRGAVSSLKGLGGDAFTMQVTAPVQRGNSGGPLLGAGGEVVGVVVSKLDEIKTAELLGDVPQNVNFAVRAEIAKLFLVQNGISPILSMSEQKMDPTDLADKASSFTVFVECR